MTMTLGRVGLGTAAGGDGLTLDNPSALDWAGDELSIEGQASAATLPDAKALRDQLLGYDLNSDERVVPLTWSEDSTVDGFYRVLDVTAGTAGQGSYLSGGWGFEWEAKLLKVPGWQAPLFEVIINGADRDTATASLDPRPGVGLAAATYESINGGSLGEAFTLATKSGTILYASLPNDYSVTSVLYRVDAGSHYAGSSRIETSPDSGSTWRSVVGRQVSNLPQYWRLSNDFVRVTANAAGGINVAFWDNSAVAWEAVDFSLGEFSVAFDGALTWASGALTVNRNSPEVCSLRVSLPGSNGPSTTASGYVDFTLRRGSPVIECYRHTDGAGKLAIFRTATDASTSITGGIENDTAVSGNKWSLHSPDAITKVTSGASGIYLTGSANEFHFGVSPITGLMPGASSNPTVSDVYFAAVDHRQRVVAR